MKLHVSGRASVSNSAWESVFQMNMDFYFTTLKLVFLNTSEYLVRYGIQMTHLLLKEDNNLEKSLYCARGGSYPRLSGGRRDLKKVPMMERLPR